jgi:hypothetical protein
MLLTFVLSYLLRRLFARAAAPTIRGVVDTPAILGERIGKESSR